MSTKIEDLPQPESTPVLEEQVNNYSRQSQELQEQSQNLNQTKLNQSNFKNEKSVPKKISIKDEINEENLLLFIILLLAATKHIDHYLQLIPTIGAHIENVFVKCALLFVIYIIIKFFVLPMIKLN